MVQTQIARSLAISASPKAAPPKIIFHSSVGASLPTLTFDSQPAKRGLFLNEESSLSPLQDYEYPSLPQSIFCN